MTGTRTWRRAAAVCGILAMAAVAAGCLQPSLNPLIAPQDAEFDSRIAGSWRCGDDEAWTFARSTDTDAPNVYTVDVRNGAHHDAMYAWVGSLGGRRFVTFTLGDAGGDTSTVAAAHRLAAFTFGRVDVTGERLEFRMLDADWVSQAHRAGLLPIGVSRQWSSAPGEDDGDVVLTAGMTDLQRFARAYADDDRVFGERIVLRAAASTGAAADTSCPGTVGSLR